MRKIEDDILVVQSHALWPIYWKNQEVRILKDCYTDTTPTRGDIVVVNTPSSWLFRFILGLPHDILDLDDRYNPALLKLNGLVLYNYTRKPYIVGKELFYYLFGGKNSISISDAHCLMLPNDPSLYKKRHPFGIIPMDSIVGRIVSPEDAAPLGVNSKIDFDSFDASGKIGHYIND